MNKLYNFFRTKYCSRSLDNLPNDIGIIYEKLKLLINYNILDFSLIKEIINLLFINLENENLNTDYTNEELIISLRKEFITFYTNWRYAIKKEYTLIKYFQIVNMTILWYILTLSMKNHKIFYDVFFEKNNKFCSKFIKALKYLHRHDSDFQIFSLIANIYEEDSQIYNIFLQYNLEELFIYNKKCLYGTIPELEQEGYKKITFSTINEISSSIYKKLLENIVNLDICYGIIFLKSNITLEDKPLVKSILCQSILRIVFSNEKNKFLSNKSNSFSIQYEITFFKNLIKKCVLFYFEKFGENTNCLFRREEIHDDLIKYTFFTHGNYLFYKSLYLNLKLIIDTYSDEDPESEIHNLSKEEFITFFQDILNNLKLLTTNLIKIILRLIYENVIEIYKESISSDNYSPVLTALFFNFIISPKLQEIYNINPSKNLFIRNVNRLIRNICFNEKFKEEDTMKYYNDIIEICHFHTKSTIEKIINTFILEDMDFLLKSELESNLLNIPSDVFYYDCEYIIDLLERSMREEKLTDTDISGEVNFIERMMEKRKKSFYLNINLKDFHKLHILGKIQTKDNNES